MNPHRRKLLNKLLTAGTLATAAPFLIRQTLAMGSRLHTQGFIKLEGTVLHNNKAAMQGAIVKPGDKISTGLSSLAIFVAGQDAYLLRSNTQLEFSAPDATIQTLNLLAGKMLSVFGKGEKRINVPTATLGIRGTAVYAEVEAERSYVCTCYGTVNIQCKSDLSVQETVVSKKHDAPRYIYAGGKVLIAKAPVINHSDDELFMLEQLVGRLPAFYVPGSYQGGNPY